MTSVLSLTPMPDSWDDSSPPSTLSDDFICSSDAMSFSSLLEHQHHIPPSPSSHANYPSDDEISIAWSIPPSPSTPPSIGGTEEEPADADALFGDLDKRIQDASIMDDRGDRDAWRGVIKLSDLEYGTAAAFKPHRAVVQADVGLGEAAIRNGMAENGRQVWWWLGQVHRANNNPYPRDSLYPLISRVDNPIAVAATAADVVADNAFGELVEIPDGESPLLAPNSPTASIASTVFSTSTTSTEPLASQIRKASISLSPPAFDWDQTPYPFITLPQPQPSHTTPIPMHTISPIHQKEKRTTTSYQYIPPQQIQLEQPRKKPAGGRTAATAKDTGIPRPFACEMCPATFSRKHDLKRHTRIHLGIRPYKCDLCGKSFSRMDALNRHNMVQKCTKVGESSPSSSILREQGDSEGSL